MEINIMKIAKTTNLGELYELNDTECIDLLTIGDEFKGNAYPEAGDYGFAVAVLTKSGNFYPGVSYQSKTYTLTIHAEAAALVNAAINGEKDIVAITGPNCHICKQLIYESALNSGIDVVVIIKEDGVIKQIPISELMLYPWPAK